MRNIIRNVNYFITYKLSWESIGYDAILNYKANINV